MSLKSILGPLAGIASIAAAPFTGGTSLSWLPTALSIGSGVAGALSNTKGARTSTSMPVTAPEDMGIAQLLRERLTSRLNTPFNMTGYENQGIQGINDAYSGITQSIGNNLTSRGLASSPIAGNAMTNINLARGGEQARFLNTLPQIQRQYEDQALSGVQNFLNARQGQQNIGAGSAVGSGLGSAAEMLAFLSGQGLFGGKKQPVITDTGIPGVTGGWPGTAKA